LLWESKNAVWQKAWLSKMKDDVVAAKASFGIIVSEKMPEQYGDMFNIESNIWIVKKRFAAALGAALRNSLTQIYAANNFSKNKDSNMERLYRYVISPEFTNRIRAIVDNYKILQDEIEKERRAAELRWGRQEKAIRSVIDNTFKFYGSFQGLAGNELIDIPELEETLLIE